MAGAAPVPGPIDPNYVCPMPGATARLGLAVEGAVLHCGDKDLPLLGCAGEHRALRTRGVTNSNRLIQGCDLDACAALARAAAMPCDRVWPCPGHRVLPR
jgi:hypothetical protein